MAKAVLLVPREAIRGLGGAPSEAHALELEPAIEKRPGRRAHHGNAGRGIL